METKNLKWYVVKGENGYGVEGTTDSWSSYTVCPPDLGLQQASMIAAAPELMEALQRILSRRDVAMQFGDDEVRARAAVAKATNS